MARIKTRRPGGNGSTPDKHQVESPSRPSLLRPAGGSNLLGNFSGRVQADFLHELNGTRGYKNYNEMRLNSPEIGGLLMAITQALLSVDWFYTSDAEAGEDDPRIEFLENARREVHNGWKNHIREAVSALVFGFAPFSIWYKRGDGGRLVWDRFFMLSQDTVMRWHKDEASRLVTAVSQFPHVYPDPIDMGRVINYRVNVEQDNPEGRSILRTAWVPYYYAKNLAHIESIAFERTGAGYPVIRMPVTADTTESTSESTDYGRAHAIVRNIRADEQAGLVLPHGWEFEFMTPTSNAGTMTIDNTIKRYHSRMMVSALSQFLLLGQDKVGALSLSEDQTDFFNMSINSFADILAETHTQQAMARLLELNGMDPTGIRLDHSPAGDVNVQSVTEGLAKAVQFGLVGWSPEDEVFYRSMAQLPDKTVEQIAEGRDAEAQARTEREQQTMALLRQPQQQERDEQTARVVYAAGNAPDDRQRRRREREYADTMSGFWDGQRERILRGARRLLRREDSFGAQPQTVNVTAPAPTINVATPPVQVDVHMPEQVYNWPEQPVPRVEVHQAEAPQVTVNVPEQPAPVVNVAPAPAPVVNVEAAQITNEIKLPRRVTEQTQIQRDGSGNITGAVSESRFEGEDG